MGKGLIDFITRIYDVAVVGAGPAGSTAARILAARGLKVLLIDAKKLPRDKPCAGVVSAKTLSVLEQEGLGVPQDLVEAEIYGLRAFGPNMEPVCMEPACEAGISLPGRPRLGITVRRRAFDWFLTEAARNAGARLIDACRLVGVGPSAARDTYGGLPALWLDTSKGRFEARVIVGADGVSGATARLAGIRLRFRWWELARTWSMDIPVNLAANRAIPVTNVAEIYFPPIPFGSGWLFPHGDHVNVGIGYAAFTRRIFIDSDGPSSQSEPHPAFSAFLNNLARVKGWEIQTISATKPGGPKEYLVPAGGFRRPIACGQVLLIGDAAGLVDPFTGEGMFNAVRSAKIAAETITDFLCGDFTGYRPAGRGGRAPAWHPIAYEYTRRCYGALLPELRRSLILTAVFFNKGGLFSRLLRRDPRRAAWLARVMHSEGAYRRALTELLLR